MNTRLLRRANGVFYFRCRWVRDPNTYRDVAVSEVEATQSAYPDSVLVPDADIEVRAHLVAGEKCKALNHREFRHPLPTIEEMRRTLGERVDSDTKTTNG